MDKGREWLIDDYTISQQSVPPNDQMMLTIMTTKSGAGSSTSGFRMSASGTVTGFGGMSASTNSTDTAGRLPAHMTRKGLLNCTSSSVALSNQLPEIKNKLFDTNVSSKEDYGGKPAMAGTISTSIENIWKTSVSHHPEEVLNTALAQMKTTNQPTSVPSNPNQIPVLDRPQFRNNIESGTFRFEDKLEDKPLLSATQRRKVYQQQLEHQNALQALSNSRRNYKRMTFIAKNHHPNGMLTSEKVEPGSEMYASVVGQLEKDKSGAEAERNNRIKIIEEGSVKKGSGGSSFLKHNSNNTEQSIIFQRKHHTKQKEGFSLAKMEEPIHTIPDPRRRQLNAYSQTQGRDCDIITGIRTCKVESPFV